MTDTRRLRELLDAARSVVKEDDLINHVEDCEPDEDSTWAYERRKEAIADLRAALDHLDSHEKADAG